MMADAVTRALDELSEHPTQHSQLKCFSYGRPVRGLFGFEWRDWQIKPTRLDPPHDEERLRLKLIAKRDMRADEEREGENNEKRYPELSPDLIKALSDISREHLRRSEQTEESAGVSRTTAPAGELPQGCFDPPDKRMCWCPDIVIFDDLSGDLRRVRFAAKPEIAALEPTINNRTNFDSSIVVVMKRLLEAGARLQKKPNAVPLEPLVICCIGGSLPEIRPFEAAEKTFWDCLYHDKELRTRTVIVLDVNDLREYENLAISSGLSWERTAQDAIAELIRSPRLRTLLEFSHLIIRFGVTGAIHITRQGEKAWAYQLYYDPIRDDRVWTETDTSGEVLGYAAVYAATLVQYFTNACFHRGEKPVLHDLAEAIADAIPTAIGRCQRLVQDGYGTPDDLEEIEISFPYRLFSKDPSSCMISSVTVPPLRSRSWSIASHASQGRTGIVARNIVRFGMRLALNQALPTHREFAEGWTRTLSKRFWSPGAIATEWQFEVKSAIEDDCVEVFRQFVRLPNRDGKAYLASILRGPGSEELLSAIEQQILTSVKSAKAIAKKKKFSDLDEYDQALSVIARDLEAELLPTISQLLRLPSPLDPRFSPTVAPIVELDKGFVLVDRREIEGIRAVQKLIKAHLDNVRDERDPTKHKPLSIAVFGPPGSGKSTAVKQIVKLFEEHPTKTELMKDAYNLAQFTKSDDLDKAFDEIVNAGAEHKVPIAFFDEFDARFNKEEWGWLKFFLSPMEDGRYRGKPVHTAIFVFAGGTSATYSQFCLENRPTTDPQVQEFGRAKGPDFVSRLRGFLNVVGINPADPDDDLYLIRRAIIVRATLVRIQDLHNDEEARIDPEMLRAILFVPHYVNGARSIRTLLEICSRSERKRVTNSALPLIHQLNMLTDGKAFLDLLTNVSADSLN